MQYLRESLRVLQREEKSRFTEHFCAFLYSLIALCLRFFTFFTQNVFLWYISHTKCRRRLACAKERVAYTTTLLLCCTTHRQRPQ